jgi:conjugative relaxase-like TrwC/TraI family protein
VPLDPRTGERLTARMNMVRREGVTVVPSRRVFYDWTLSPPKSVSVVALLQDDRIVELHNRAVRSALSELEVFAETRVRRRGANGERVTGQIVAACFQQDTSRELDPHLHTHGIVFNATFGREEGRWKALHAVGMYRAQKFVENVYYHELAKGLRALDYEIVNNARDFEVAGVPQGVIERFSKRHRQIDEEASRITREVGTTFWEHLVSNLEAAHASNTGRRTLIRKRQRRNELHPFDRTPKGRNENGPWWRRHDEYDMEGEKGAHSNSH